jgi:regulator of sigma E protease
MKRSVVNLAVSLFGLNLVIVVHELGHFVMCKLFDVKVPVFSVGFGPKVIGYKIGDTLFQLALLPLGGYNAIDPASLAQKTYAQKIIIDFAGITFNLIFAFLLLWFIAIMINRHITIPVIATITPKSPAAHSELAINDRIVLIDGKEIENNMTRLIYLLQKNPGKKVTFTVDRDGYSIDMPVTLGAEHPMLGSHVGWLGATFKTKINNNLNVLTTFKQAALNTYIFLKRITTSLFVLWRKKNREELSGPIGIISSMSSSATLSIQFFALWLAIININVAIFNLLPIPMLDGGHIVQDTIEFMYGAPIPANIMQAINLLFLFLFILLMINVSARDVNRMGKKR